MSRIDDLRHVAGLAGVSTQHRDALGIVHEPGEETLQRLIAALGLPLEPGEAREALGNEQVRPLGLGSLAIIGQEDPSPALQLIFPPSANTAEWQLVCETGEHFAGRTTEPHLLLPSGLPLGYHRLMVSAGGRLAEPTLAVAPPSCYLPGGLGSAARHWGFTVQLYGLRSAANWGIGDFVDVAALFRDTAPRLAAMIGVNPLHALFAAEPGHFSPYSPSSRLWLN